MEDISNPNTFSGSLTVAQGEVLARQNKARNNLIIAAAATFSQNQGLGLNQDSDETTTVDGTLNLNSRSVSDNGAFAVNIGTLGGASSGVITATSTAATHTVNVTSDTTDGTFAGVIEGTLSLVKSGTASLILTGDSAQTEATSINGGSLIVNGSLPATSVVTVNDTGTLGGSGFVNGPVILKSGSSIAPGNSVGTLNTSSETWEGGAALDIEMTHPSGTPGSGWDFLDITGTLTLNPNLTAGNPFIIRLAGPASGFDNQQSQSWLIVSTTGISGAFMADAFTVDASSFALTHSLDGGSFSLSRSGNNLQLDFEPASFTALESWRINHFGSEANSGDGADNFDFDQDGRANLLEYAVGSNPKSPDAEPILSLGTSPDGTKFAITFNRIADPLLIYEVVAESSLPVDPWTSIWTSTGASNTAGSVTVQDTENISDHSRRFMKLSVAY